MKKDLEVLMKRQFNEKINFICTQRVNNFIKKCTPLYPVIRCIKENKVIALCTLKYQKNEKICDKHWNSSNVIFLNDEYIIDFSKIKNGDKVTCPKCDSEVDFMLFPSDTVPKL
jgi:hypothetical protein